MPYPLNNVSTQDAYVDALTCLFPRLRPAFSSSTFNKAVYYQLAFAPPQSPGLYQWDFAEHYMAPSLSTFQDVVKEGGPPGFMFAGIRFRSAAVGLPGAVSVA